MSAAVSSDGLEEIKRVCTEARLEHEAGLPYIFLPCLELPVGCEPRVVDCLLCLGTRDGYPSRLFFAERVMTAHGLNWNAHGTRILGRSWSAFSWKLTTNSLRPAQVLAAHMRALR